MTSLPDTVIFNRCAYDERGNLIGHEPMRVRRGEVMEYCLRSEGSGVALVLPCQDGSVSLIPVRETPEIVARLTGAPINLRTLWD
ncbi:hypothetical protein [Ruegeria marina]|uniref:Uncharacterized protein n=1 Tax=Ruegeria marina TaxID=639004 RepID=A0A1G7DAN3_9RHOB|nr:hypothetical protein [Ruegeria marina]SDE47785.1 hypothetical protein SAMN04488239_12052 [Ruegeria marina]